MKSEKKLVPCPNVKAVHLYIFLAGMLQIGSLLGCVLAGISIERLGRRFTMRLVASLSFLSGYLIIMLANSAALILLGKLKQLNLSQCPSIRLSVFLCLSTAIQSA